MAPLTVTGDVLGKAMLVARDLKAIRYPLSIHNTMEIDRLVAAQPRDLLAILAYVVQHYSQHVAVLAAEYLLCSKRHSKFLEGVFRLAREKFNVVVSVSTSQFLNEAQYAERKLMTVHQIIAACREYHSTTARQKRLSSLKAANKDKKDREIQKTAQQVHINGGCCQDERHGFDNSSSTLLPAAVDVVLPPCVLHQQPQEWPSELARPLPFLYANGSSQHDDSYYYAATDAEHCSSPWIPPVLQQQQTYKHEQQHTDLNPIQIKLEELENRINQSDATLKTALNNQHTETHAHLVVLENRLTSLERRYSINNNHYSTSAFNNSKWRPGGGYLYTDSISTARGLLFGGQHLMRFPATVSASASKDAEDKTAQEKEKEDASERTTTTTPLVKQQSTPVSTPAVEVVVEQEQQWVRWNSPTACFNPLYSHTASSLKYHSPPSTVVVKNPSADFFDGPDDDSRQHTAESVASSIQSSCAAAEALIASINAMSPLGASTSHNRLHEE